MSSSQQFRFPTIRQWMALPRFLSPREKILLFFLVLFFLGSTWYLMKTFFLANTYPVPKKGGEVVEGIVGMPRFLNPIFSEANDVDRDLVQLLFAGLAKYNQKGEIVPDLAHDFSIEEGGRIITITLKEGLKWQDGFPLTADDILFTISTLQDPRQKSPVRANWIGVETEKLSQTKIRLKLKEPYAPILDRLILKPIPVHIWQNISPENFVLSSFNIKPVGSGPYRVKEVIVNDSGTIEMLKLEPNPRYHGKQPFIKSFGFRFFANEEQLQDSFKKGEIQSYLQSSWKGGALPSIAAKTLDFFLPRYYAIFFNLKSQDKNDAVLQKDIRQALENAIDKESLILELFGTKGKKVSSPLLPEIFGGQITPPQERLSQEEILALFVKHGYKIERGKIVRPVASGEGIKRDLVEGSEGQEVKLLQECLARDREVYPEGIISGVFGELTKKAVIKFQEKYAKDILKPQNLTAGTGKVGPATREKLNLLCFVSNEEPLPLKLTLTAPDISPLKEAAENIKKQWERLGLSVEVKLVNPLDIEREVIRPRNYQILLFGEILGPTPDPFPFWHSSQKKDPGLNLSSYENKKLDSLLEQARKELDKTKRIELYSEIQKIILNDIPAIFLFDVPLTYVVKPEIKGITSGLIADPSQRFALVSDWYIKTKRDWGKPK